MSRNAQEGSSDKLTRIDPLGLQGLVDSSQFLAEAIVDTVRDCLLILDRELRIRVANRNFFLSFEVTPEETMGRFLFELGNGQWNIPDLKRLLQEVLPQNNSFRNFEVTHTFPHLGSKTMLLNAQKLRRSDGESELILLAIEDVTELRRMEAEVRDREQKLAQAVKEKELLVAEVHHRVKNNLHAVISLLHLHAAHTTDPRVVEALSEAEGRVHAIAHLHETLYTSPGLSAINFGEYLLYLTNALRTIHGRSEISFQVENNDVVIDMETAVPLGLIANELIVNSFKHAFPAGRKGSVNVAIEYVPDSVSPGQPLDEAEIRLRVEDNGVGLPPGIVSEETKSLGLRIVQILSKQLHAQVVFQSANGLKAGLTFRP